MTFLSFSENEIFDKFEIILNQNYFFMNECDWEFSPPLKYKIVREHYYQPFNRIADFTYVNIENIDWYFDENNLEIVSKLKKENPIKEHYLIELGVKSANEIEKYPDVDKNKLKKYLNKLKSYTKIDKLYFEVKVINVGSDLVYYVEFIHSRESLKVFLNSILSDRIYGYGESFNVAIKKFIDDFKNKHNFITFDEWKYKMFDMFVDDYPEYFV